MNKINVLALRVLVFLSIACLGIAPAALAQQEHSIQSKIMEETREIVVHLPTNYDPDNVDGYPVIYMLDAGTKDKLTAEIASYYNWGEIMPEVIVVGLKNVRRGPDFLPPYYQVELDGEQVSGNGGKLLAYIKDELIPFVDNQFKTSSNRILAGHSWAGQFLTYVLSQSPDLFDAYFITSPSFGDEERWSKETFEYLKQTLGQDMEFPDFVYLSVGGDEHPRLISDYLRLAALLQQYLPSSVNLYHEIQDSAVHQSNGAISIPKAMQLYFSTSTANE